MAENKNSIKVISQNKKAYHDYFVEERYEAGVELFGTEVKSIRAGKVNIKVSLSKTATDKDEQTVNPFTSLNYTAGYFPVDAEVVDIGAGASYDTKYYIPQN